MAVANEAFSQAAKFISGWSRVMMLTHERPDGDALGCLVALTRLLSAQDKQASALLFDEADARYDRVLGDADLQSWPSSSAEELAAQFDGVIICDTCALGQLSPAADFLQAKLLPVLVLDHHITRDDITDCALIDETASSASLIVEEWARALHWHIDAKTAEALFAGIATDTGWFRFSNTDSRTLLAAARLLEQGVRADELYQAFYLSSSEARLRLLGRMLDGMELHANGRLAITCITQAMLRECGATTSDTQELINETQQLGSVDVSVLAVESENGPIKVSLRSKRLVNVAAVAQELGGGGHERAAGVRIPGKLEDVKQIVLNAVLGRLQEES